MAVEGQPRLQAQGIPGAQARGLRPQLHQPVPEPGGLGALDVHLVADGLAGVAGLGHPDGVPLKGEGVQGVFHRLGDLLPAGEDHQQLLGLGALDGDGRHIAGDDRHLGVEGLDLLVQVSQILVGVGGVHHQEVAVRLKAVEIGVVHGAAAFVGNDGVLGLVDVQGQYVAGEHMLQEGHSLRSLHQDAAHVGHVEEAAEVPGVQVLGHNIRGVLDGHLPAAEVHHGGAGGHMHIIQLGPLQLAHCGSSISSSRIPSRWQDGAKKAEARRVPLVTPLYLYLRDSRRGNMPSTVAPPVHPVLFRFASRSSPFT